MMTGSAADASPLAVSFPVHRRQADDELGPLTDALAVNGHRSAVQGDDLLDEGQPDAEPDLGPIESPVHLGKQLEHVGEDLGRDPDPGVADTDDRVVPLAACG